MAKLLYPEKLGRVRELIYSWLERPKYLLKKKSSKDYYTYRKLSVIVKIIALIFVFLFVLFFYFELTKPVYCCGSSNQKTIDDTSISYNYDIKTDGGTIKTEKPITFILYEFGISLNMRGAAAEHPPDNITRQICVSSARNIDTGLYEPCISINLIKKSETISGENSKSVNYQFFDSDGFEWKRKFIVPRKESISFEEKNMEYIDVIPSQQSDVSIFYPFLIILTTIFSMVMDAYSKYLEIEQEESYRKNSIVEEV